jgi:diguanylate cyclase (GGDEF)-like protein
MDIKDFSLVNEEHGHTTGDQLLTFAARIIKNQLRQMDFLAHPSADEFWAILPGATGDIVELVIERLDRAFSHSRFTLPSNTTIDIELHFGTAAFKKDGDTSSQLVQAALRRKTEEKDPIDPAMSPVIPFPLRNQQISENPF